MRVAAPVFIALVLSACAASPPCPTRTEIRRVPQPVHIDIPAELIEPLPVPALPDDLSNRDLEADTSALEDIIDRAQADRAKIRERQERRRREP